MEISLHVLNSDKFKKLKKGVSVQGIISNKKWPSKVVNNIIKTDLREFRGYEELMIWSNRIITDLDGNILGDIGFKGLPDVGGRIEIGYEVFEEHRNKGIATKAISILINEVFSKRDDVKEVVAEVLKINKASQKVLERNGFIINYPKGNYLYYIKRK